MSALDNLNLTHSNPRVQRMIDTEIAKFTRASANIAAACEVGRISEHDRDERIARAEHWHAGVIAHFSGQQRPKERKQQPLDDPTAGQVGS